MKKSSIQVFVFAISASILFSSCGVMFGGSKYNATILAKGHPKADIYVDGQKIGTGQATGLFRRNRDLAVELREEGCTPKTQIFPNKFRTGNFILSIATFGLLGLGVDLGTGASYKPDHKHNPNVKKNSNKDFEFNVDYPECQK